MDIYVPEFIPTSPPPPPPPLKVSSRVHNIWTLCPYLGEKLETFEERPIILFIDADNTQNVLRVVKELCPKPYTKDWKVQVVAIHSLGQFSSVTTSIRNSPWFHHISPSTTVKDAADTAVSMLIGALNVYLNYDIKFIVMSRDHFIQEVEYQIGLSGREIVRDNGMSLDINYYSSLLELSPTVQMPEGSLTIWETLPDGELIARFKERWKGSNSAFVRRYACDQSNFVKWLSGRKRSMASRECVITFMKEST